MAYKREEYLKKITELLAFLESSIRLKNDQKWYDSNLISEDFYVKLLNIIYGWDLVNMNDGFHVEPGVDLIDRDEQIVVQVSTTNTSQKIKHTIKEYKEHNPEMKGYTLYMMFIIGKQKTYDATFKSDDHLAFDKNQNILDNSVLLSFLNNNQTGPIDKLEEVLKHLEKAISIPESKINNNLPYLKSNFTKNTDPVIGRERQLELIQEKFAEQGDPGRNRIVFIRGMGGIGKSVLAKRYTEIHQNSYENILEVSADSFRGAILAINLRNWSGDGLDEESKFSVKFQIVKDILEKQRTLLIVHDYNTSDDPDARWRELPCDLVITTWNDWKGIGKQIRLRETDISEEDAVNIFTHYYLTDSEYQAELREYITAESEAVRALVKSVEYHPLSIKVLAKQMVCEDDDLITPRQMLDQISFSDEKEFVNLHESGEGSNPENASAHHHLEVVFLTVLRNGKLNKEQLEALRFMTLTSSVYGISTSRFSEWTGLNKKLLTQLEKRGWVEYDRSGKDYLDNNDEAGIYKMPMVISDILYNVDSLQSTTQNSNMFIGFLKKIDIDKCIGYEKRSALIGQSIALADHIQVIGNLENALLFSFTGYNLTEHFVYKKGLEYQEKALAIRLDILGENHPDTANSYNNVGMSYEELGEKQKGLEYKEKALTIWLNVLGENHPDTANSYNNVGCSYGQLGDWKKGLEYQEKALAIQMNILGENHPNTANSYNNVSMSYEELGERKKDLDYQKKGLEYQEKALAIRLRILGENHPDTASSYENLGFFYEQLGDWRKGLDYWEKALAIRLNVLGENHLATAKSYNNVGLSYEDMGDSEKALEYKEKALAISLKILGENHIDTATCYNNVGYSYERLGDQKKGLAYQEKALAIRLNILGENHPDTATSYDNIGLSYEDMGDKKKSLEYKEKALAIRLNVLGENHPDTAKSYNNISLSYEDMGDREKALEYKGKALAIRLNVLGENHPDTANSYYNMGFSYFYLKDYSKSYDYLNKAYHIYKNFYGERNIQTQQIKSNMNQVKLYLQN